MSKYLKHFRVPGNYLSFPVYVLWLLGVLMLAWGTVPFIISPWILVPPPPEWLSKLARLLFYRDYIF